MTGRCISSLAARAALLFMICPPMLMDYSWAAPARGLEQGELDHSARGNGIEVARVDFHHGPRSFFAFDERYLYRDVALDGCLGGRSAVLLLVEYILSSADAELSLNLSLPEVCPGLFRAR